MGKKKRERTLSDNEAKAVARMLRISPQKLNLLAQLIRGKKVSTALADLEFSRKRIARDVRKCLESAIANAENNHDLDVDDLVVVQAHVGKALVIKRHEARGRGRVGAIFNPFSNLTIVLREVEAAANKGTRPWVRKSIRSAFVSASTAPGIRGGMPARRLTARCCTRTWRSARRS